MDFVLDFGDEVAKDVDTKLEILKFSYNWADEVEKQERLRKEVIEPALEDRKNESKVKTFTKEWKEVPREPLLDFGDGPVPNLDAKLEILKFPYSWAEKVEEEEKGTKKVAEEGESKQKIPLDNSSKIPELHHDLKAEADAKIKALEVSKLGTQQIKSQSLCEEENENDDCFIPRKLFLFVVAEFKSDWEQLNKNTVQPDVLKPPKDAFSSTYKSETAVTNTRKGICRRIKRFLGIR